MRWYDEISMEQVYKKSCKLALEKLPQSNEAIKNLLQALARKDIRALLNFERVLDYLETLIETDETQLPAAVNEELYRLGLLSDSGFAVGAPTTEQLRKKIKENYAVVRRISNLEQKERQNISGFLAKNPDNSVVRLVLEYYRSPSVDLLKELSLNEVEKCLKTATNSNSDSNPKPPKKGGNSPTVATSRMVFEGKDGLIEDFVDKAEEEIDNRPENDKSCVTVRAALYLWTSECIFQFSTKKRNL